MARRDILLRLNKGQAEAIKYAVEFTLADPPMCLGAQGEQSMRIANMKLTKVLERHNEKITPPSPRFPDVGCSSCGQSFGPGDNGFSHCEHHKGLKGRDR